MPRNADAPGIVRASSLLASASSASVTQHAAALRPAAPRLREVDGLRAIAVLAVMAFHFDLPLYGGFLGVDLFFAISGFVIARGLLAQAKTSVPTRRLLRQFYARRTGRLLPAAAVVVIATVILGVVRGPAFGSLARSIAHGATAIGGTSNWFMIVHPDQPGEQVRPLLHTWSLGVEEQCYLLLPLLLLSVRARARTLAFGVAGVGVVLSFVAGRLWPDPSVAFFLTPTRIAPVAFGVGLAALLERIADRSGPEWAEGPVSRWSGPLLAALSFLLTPLLLFTSWNDAWLYRGGLIGVAVVVTGIVGAAAVGGDGPVHWVLRHPVLQAVGARSYCLYLVHFPLAFLFNSFATGPRTLLRMVASFALAEVMHRTVEYRFLQGATARSLWRFAPLAMCGASISGFVLAAAGAK